MQCLHKARYCIIMSRRKLDFFDKQGDNDKKGLTNGSVRCMMGALVTNL